MQQNQPARGGKRSSFASPMRAEKQPYPEVDWSGDLDEIRSRLSMYEGAVSRYVSNVNSKQEILGEMLLRHDE